MIKHTEKNDLISIVLPTFNSDRFIVETLDSVIGQSYRDFELLVVDDCSSDNTVAIIQEYMRNDSRILFFQTQRNSGGPATPRNRALDNANGAYIAFIDSDDVWHVDKLSTQLKEMKALQLNFSSTRLCRFVHGSARQMPLLADSKEHEFISLSRLLKKNIFANSSVMLKSDFAQGFRFSEHPDNTAIEDYLGWIQLHRRKDIRSARLAQRLVYYRVRQDSISRSKLLMAIKIFRMLGDQELIGEPLGMRRYIYFATYLVGSLRSEMFA